MQMKFGIYLSKMVLLGMLGLAIITGLGACGQSQTTDDSGIPYITPTTTSTNSSGSNTITYKSVEITILSVDQQAKYNDDDGNPSPYLLRVSIKEHNTYSNGTYLLYRDSFRLVEANGTQIAPVKIQDEGEVPQGVVRNNWVDFPVNSKQDVNTLILHIGTNTEHQIDVPLKQHPDLSQYQPITVTPNAKLTYGGVNWTVTQATAQLSADATQATSGNRYIVLTFKADNPTNNTFYPFPSENFRLQAPDTTTAPTNSTLPAYIAGGSSGTTGTVTFLMPQNDKTFTLKFLARQADNVAEASANIQF